LRTERRFESGEGALQDVNVAQVTGLEVDLSASSLQLIGERAAPFRVDVDEADTGALVRKSTDDLCADAGCPAGDEDNDILQARIDGKGHWGSSGTIRWSSRFG
jgi:hypothetical protein